MMLSITMIKVKFEYIKANVLKSKDWGIIPVFTTLYIQIRSGLCIHFTSHVIDKNN